MPSFVNCFHGCGLGLMSRPNKSISCFITVLSGLLADLLISSRLYTYIHTSESYVAHMNSIESLCSSVAKEVNK